MVHPSASLGQQIVTHSAGESSALAKRLYMDLNESYKGVCDKCALTCSRLHGDRHRSRLRPPCFIQTVADYSVEGGPSCWMQVPAEFAGKYLPHVSQKGMILETGDGWQWPVLYSVGHGFQAGWNAFVAANELVIGESLFFSLVKEDKFIVHVFNKSGCEKRLLASSTMPSTLRGPGGYLKETVVSIWEQKLAHVQAQAVLEKSKPKKMNPTESHMDVPEVKHRGSFKGNQHPLKRKKVAGSPSRLDNSRRGCDADDEKQEERAADLGILRQTSKGKIITEFVPLRKGDQAFAYAIDANANVFAGRRSTRRRYISPSTSSS